jgi:alkylation response protein AidB-like acyl-CoA dehydrogenase
MGTPLAARGGSWLLEAARAADVMTPERVSGEHRLIAQTAAELSINEVSPAAARLEAKDWSAARTLLGRCGELGLLGVNVPESYGGVALDQVSGLVVSEQLARIPSFGAAFGAHANLCTVPIVLFGTDDQKARYLPRLASGEIVGAYALSESGSGSDALGARTRADRQPDGSFRLTGEKMWITNGGFADLFIVFAQVDGTHFSAFIVERAFGGVTSGKEEHKMGLHGSSTTALLLQDVIVPAANVLGEVGKAHKIAFTVLDFGRLELGALCTGGCRIAIGEAARYAGARQQFGRPIAAFGAIRHKIGEMTARTFALEALMYRTAGAIDAAVAGASDRSGALGAALEEMAVESSIAKIAGSETLDFVLDENIQVHGGNGYVRDYPAEQRYRDARVNRIFEGTNEINRLLVPGLLMKRAARGELPLVSAARAVQDEILASAAPGSRQTDELLAAEASDVEALRKTALFVAGAALQRFGKAVEDEQEVLLWVADLLIETYAAGSAVLRARAAAMDGHATAGLQADAARLHVAGAVLRAEVAAREALAAISAGDALRAQLTALRRLLAAEPVDTVALRRKLAGETVARGRYVFA